MVEAEWDGQTLRARGTNKAGQMALRGDRRDEGDVVLTRDDMTSVRFKEAGRMVNGNLIVTATDGAKYQMHFRRRDNDAWRELASALGA